MMDELEASVLRIRQKCILMSIVLVLSYSAFGCKSTSKSKVTTTDASETVAGEEIPPIVVDGSQKLGFDGQMMTDDEIQKCISSPETTNTLKSWFGDEYTIASNWFFLINLETLSVNYYYCQIPVVYDQNVIGLITLLRGDDGSIMTTIAKKPDTVVMGFDGPVPSVIEVLDSLLKSAPNEKYLVAYYGAFAYLLDSNNAFHCLGENNNLITVTNAKTLYKNLYNEQSTVSGEILDEK